MKKFFAILCSAMLVTTTVSATIEVKQDLDTQEIIVKGNIGDAQGVKTVPIEVLNRGTKIDDNSALKDKLSYIDEVTVNEDGSFTLVYSPIVNDEATDSYGVYARARIGDTVEESELFEFYSKGQIKRAVAAVNNASDVKTALEDNLQVLGINATEYGKLEDTPSISNIYKEVNAAKEKELFDVEKPSVLTNLVNGLIAAARVNEMTSSTELKAYLADNEDIFGLKKLPANVTFEANKDRIENLVLSDIIKADIVTPEDLADAYTESVILRSIEKSVMYQDIEKVIADNEAALDKLNLDDYYDLDNGDYVLKKLVGESFKNMGAFATQFNKLVSEAEDKKPSGSTSSGGSSGGSSGRVPGLSSKGEVVINSNYVPSDAPVQVEGFKDLDSVEWAKPAIRYLAAKQIINGVSADLFEPNRNITREEFVKIIVNAFNVTADGENVFTDVDVNAWYAPFVKTAYAAGIIKGIDETTFGVGQNITREDAATILDRVIKLSGLNFETAEVADFADVDTISDYAKESVAFMHSAGIINGVGDNNFAPRENTTRASAAKMIYEVLMKGGKAE